MMMLPSVSTKTAIAFQATEGGGGAPRQGQCSQGGQGRFGRAQETMGKPWENGKIVGKPWENGKTMGKPIGKA